MPEAPEVETIRLGLKSVINKKIINVQVANHKMVINQKKRIEDLIKLTISRIDRKGKFLLWYFNNNNKTEVAINHLGMTGLWYLYSNEKWNNFDNPFKKYKHWKVYFELEDNSHLLFVDARTFGRFVLVHPEEVYDYEPISNLGPDILEKSFDIDEFKARIRGLHIKRKKEIGKALLDPTIVSGCGNIYKCESLFRARINPFVHCNQLSDEQIELLGEKLSEVGQDALKNKGSSIRDYMHPDGYTGLMQNKFMVYGRDDEECLICKSVIVRDKQGDRSTFWCPKCQI